MSEDKTHYRKVFKSDHLGVADLEDLIESKTQLVFTISHVKQEIGVRVAGKKGNFNIAYFVEGIKPLVLNATNSKVMKGLTNSSFVEDWHGLKVALYIDKSASFGGEVTGGVRINPNPVPVRKYLTQDMTTAWTNAIEAYKRDSNLDSVKKRIDISPDNEKLLIEQANAVS